MESKAYLIALTNVFGLGNRGILKLIECFKDPKVIWHLPPSSWAGLGIRASAIKSWQEAQRSDPLAQAELIFSKGIKVSALGDHDYPKLLTQISDPPAIIFYQGDLSCLQKRTLAVVGSRKITSYGRQVTEHLVRQLSNLGVTIISGLASGVDTIAHHTTLENGGQTAAILGGGLWHVFPAENEQLAQKIIQKNGVLISEYPPDQPPASGQFPARNRIIAGLSEAVLVTEAATGSGSLITAREALDQGREVFAVPGPITSFASLGTALLIKQGATLVTRVEDILEVLKINPLVSLKSDLKLSDFEQQIVALLQSEQKHIDELIRHFKTTPATLASALLRLELKGVIDNLSPGMYIATMKI